MDSRIKHGQSNTKLFYIRNGMINRCYNESVQNYKYYGARGVTVCDEWLNSENGMINFYNWAMNNGYKEGLSIDRIDPYGNYEPSNCRWATMKEQRKNQRERSKKPKYITDVTGKKVDIDVLATEVGITPRYLKRKIVDGESVENISKISKDKHMKYKYKGIEMSISEISKETGIEYPILYARIKKEGMSVEEAINKPIKRRQRKNVKN